MVFKTNRSATLLELCTEVFPESSKTTIRSWIEQGRIAVEGKRVFRSNTQVPAGATIELLARPHPKEGPLTIHYEDAHIIVVEKPSGLLSVATDGGTEPSVHAWIKHRYPGRRIPVVHRLDKDTSGLMVFALTDTAFHILKEELKNRKVKRLYRAVVEGRLEGRGTWDSFLLEDPSLTMRVVPAGTKGSERAITRYTVLKNSKEFSLIDCELTTGKKNQIRAQAAAASHPVAGDRKYGALNPRAWRLCLHARILEFDHPILKKPMRFESPPPRFFEKLLSPLQAPLPS